MRPEKQASPAKGPAEAACQAIDSIFQGDDMLVRHFRLPDQPGRVCITFGERTGTLAGTGFGTATLLASGIDVIAVQNTRKDWYDALAANGELLAEIARRAAAYSSRAAYGSSMGAFAAIYFATVLDADCVVAISPLQSIWHDWDRRYAADHPRCPARLVIGPESIAMHCRYNIFYDPFDLDGRHHAIFQGLIPAANLVSVPAPYSGHPSGHFLSSLGLLRPMVIEAIEGRLAGRPRYRDKRRSNQYVFNLAEACLARRKAPIALRLNDLLLRARSDSGEYFMQRAKILDALRRHVDAAIAGEKAASLMPNNVHIVAHTLHIMRKAGLLAYAKRLAATHAGHAGNPVFERAKAGP